MRNRQSKIGNRLANPTSVRPCLTPRAPNFGFNTRVRQGLTYAVRATPEFELKS